MVFNILRKNKITFDINKHSEITYFSKIKVLRYKKEVKRDSDTNKINMRYKIIKGL